MPLVTTTPFPLAGLILNFNEDAKFFGNDTDASDRFGTEVAFSSDKSTVMVGATSRNSSSGGVYVFANGGSPVLEQVQFLESSDIQTGDVFGWQIAINTDATTAVITATGEDTGGSGAGAAYIFTKAGGSPLWTEQQKIQASDKQADDIFGTAAAISGDGNTVVIGANGEDTGGSLAGAAYVFGRTNGVWVQQQKIQTSDVSAFDSFGTACAMTSDGNTIFVTAENTAGGNLFNGGTVYVFTRSGSPSVWTQAHAFSSSPEVGGQSFGRSIECTPDGSTVVVGAYKETANGSPDAGAAYVFTSDASPISYTQQAKLLASDGAANDRFGWRCSISSNGNRVVISAPTNTTTETGAAYVYKRDGSSWAEQQIIVGSDSIAQDDFGYKAEMSADGSVIIIGARNETTKGGDAGAVYYYTP